MKTGALQWRHNDHNGVSNHQPHGCLLNCLFRRRSEKTSKLRVTGLCVWNSPGPVNSPHKGPVTRKMFPFDDVIMWAWHGSNRTITKHNKAEQNTKNIHHVHNIQIKSEVTRTWYILVSEYVLFEQDCRHRCKIPLHLLKKTASGTLHQWSPFRTKFPGWLAAAQWNRFL